MCPEKRAIGKAKAFANRPIRHIFVVRLHEGTEHRESACRCGRSGDCPRINSTRASGECTRLWVQMAQEKAPGKVLAGHPDYQVIAGKVLMDGENLLELEPDERARRGSFMAFQYPSEFQV